MKTSMNCLLIASVALIQGCATIKPSNMAIEDYYGHWKTARETSSFSMDEQEFLVYSRVPSSQDSTLEVLSLQSRLTRFAVERFAPGAISIEGRDLQTPTKKKTKFILAMDRRGRVTLSREFPFKGELGIYERYSGEPPSR